VWSAARECRGFGLGYHVAAAQTGAMQCVDTAFTHEADKACGSSVPPDEHCSSWLQVRKQAAAAANLTAQTALRVRMCDLANQFAARGRFFNSRSSDSWKSE
jgi:hypothetical protein